MLIDHKDLTNPCLSWSLGCLPMMSEDGLSTLDVSFHIAQDHIPKLLIFTWVLLFFSTYKRMCCAMFCDIW